MPHTGERPPRPSSWELFERGEVPISSASLQADACQDHAIGNRREEKCKLCEGLGDQRQLAPRGTPRRAFPTEAALATCSPLRRVAPAFRHAGASPRLCPGLRLLGPLRPNSFLRFVAFCSIAGCGTARNPFPTDLRLTQSYAPRRASRARNAGRHSRADGDVAGP